MKKFITILFLLISFSVFAQPINDICSGAQVVTPDGSCVGGTTVAAGDHWIGTVGCQSGNHIEVWYSFVATNTQLNISVTNGTMTGNIEFILVESTGPCAGLSLQGSLCGASPLTGSITSLTIGATYYYTISSSTSSQGTFTTCVNNVAPPPPSPGQDCPTSTILCASTNFSIGSLGLGTGAVAGNLSNENLSALGCLSTNEKQSQWYTFTVGQTGTLEFMINPNVYTNDYDWAVYNITTSGCALTPGGGTAGGATQVACNYSGCYGTTGIAANPLTTFGTTGGLGAGLWQNNNPAGPGDCFGKYQWSLSPPTLTAGNTYAMVIDNFSVANSGFAFTYGATQTVVIGQPATFTTSLDATCLIVTVNRALFYTGNNSTYFWNFGDGFTSTAGTPGPHTYGSIGTYTVSLTVTDAVGCIQTFSQTVNIGCIPLPIELKTFNGHNSGNINIISWTTLTEINNNYFTIERSKDAVNFEQIGTVGGAGNNNTELSYTLQDDSYTGGINYYRLKQTDFNGEFSYSETIAINNNDNSNYVIRADNKHIYLTGEYNYRLYDVVGNLVKSGNSDVVNGADVACGLYILKIDGFVLKIIFKN